eukprot:12401160-Karenia_brevis.AAC.1
MDGLRRLASLVSAHMRGKGCSRSPRDLVARMRVDLERALLWNLADVTLVSLGSSARTRRRDGRDGG